MAIPHNGGVDGATVHTNLQRVVGLGYKYHGHGTRTQAFTNVPLGQQLLYVPLNLFGLFGVGAVGAQFGSGAPGMRSMRCSMPQRGGSPSGTSYGNTSWNSCKRDIKGEGTFLNVLVKEISPLHMRT